MAGKAGVVREQCMKLRAERDGGVGGISRRWHERRRARRSARITRGCARAQREHEHLAARARLRDGARRGPERRAGNEGERGGARGLLTARSRVRGSGLGGGRGSPTRKRTRTTSAEAEAGRWGGRGVVASGEVLGRWRIQIGEEGEAQEGDEATAAGRSRGAGRRRQGRPRGRSSMGGGEGGARTRSRSGRGEERRGEWEEWVRVRCHLGGLVGEGGWGGPVRLGRPG